MRFRAFFRFWPVFAAAFLAACSAGPAAAPEPGDADYVPPDWTAPSLAYDATDYLPAAVVDYRQAPGVHAASSTYRIADNIAKLLDFPDGGGSYAPENGSLVSLGMAGGYVVLEFDPPLENYRGPADAEAPDFIVYGNAYYKSGNAAKVWHEPGTVWVMADTDDDGSRDGEIWYLLAPASKAAAGDAWTALVDSASSLSTVTYSAADYAPSWWPTEADGATSLTFAGVLLLPDSLYSYAGDSPILRGLADSAPTLKRGDLSGTGTLNVSGEADDTVDGADDYPGIDPEYFYPVPDTVGDRDVDAQSGGGAAMDIDWAVDPGNSFASVDMGGTSVRWVKIVSASTLRDATVGDYSCEVDAVVRALAP